jgi:hypothetical protein
VQHRVLDKTPIPAHILILNFSFAHIALVLNLDKLYIYDKAKDFDNIPYNLIGRNSLNQTDCVLSLKISHLVLGQSNHFKIVGAKL